MYKTILALAATLGMSLAATAADLPSRKTAPAFVPPPALTWTGFYAGANVGGSWRSGRSTGAVTVVDPVYAADSSVVATGVGVIGNSTVASAGISGGVQVGYNYQVMPMLVVGAEADFQGTSMGSGANGSTAAKLVYLNTAGVADNTWVGYSAANTLDWFGTVRGRVGVIPLVPTLMVYGTAGFAYGNVHQANGLWAVSALQTGWTAGGGVEYKLTPNWSVKGEYLYTQLSGSNSNVWNQGYGVNNVNNTTSFNTVRAGLNYNFVTESMPTLARF